MILGNTLLQRHTTKHLVLNTLIAMHTSETINLTNRTKTEVYFNKLLDSTVSVECEVDSFSPDDISHLANQAGDLARAAVDLLSFIHGWGLSVDLDTIIEPND